MMSKYLLSDRIRSGTDIMQRIAGGQRPALIELSDEVAALEAEIIWMRREIERVGVALFTGANGYVGTEDDLKAVGQFVEGVCETMEAERDMLRTVVLDTDRATMLQALEDISADNLRFIKANAEVANLNADLQIENIRLGEIEEESAAVIAMARSFANFPSWLENLETALAPGDLSKLTTQQKPDMESMLRASPSCGMDGCLWEREETRSPTEL